MDEVEFNELYKVVKQLCATEANEFLNNILGSGIAHGPATKMKRELAKQAYDLQRALLLLLFIVLPVQRVEVYVHCNVTDFISDTEVENDSGYALAVDSSHEKNAQMACARPSAPMERVIPIPRVAWSFVDVWIKQARVVLLDHPYRTLSKSVSRPFAAEATFLSACGERWCVSDLSRAMGKLSYGICGMWLTPGKFRKLRATYLHRQLASSTEHVRRGVLSEYARLEGHTEETLRNAYVLRDTRRTSDARRIIEYANAHLFTAADNEVHEEAGTSSPNEEENTNNMILEDLPNGAFDYEEHV